MRPALTVIVLAAVAAVHSERQANPARRSSEMCGRSTIWQSGLLFLFAAGGCGGGGGPPSGTLSERQGTSRGTDNSPTPKNVDRSLRTKEGGLLLKEKLAELDSFKVDAKFHDLGFARSGPYHAWLDSVQAAYKSRSYAHAESVAFGDLMQLGQEYRKTKGQENTYTRFARTEIQKAISPPPTQ